MRQGIVHSILYIALGLWIQFFRRRSKKRPILSLRVLIFSILIPFIIISLYIKFSLLYDNKYARGAVFGDLPFHLNLISSFAYGCNYNRSSLFSVVTPFFSGEPLAYPFIPNYYSAVIHRCCNVSLHECIVIPSIVFAFALFVVLSRIVFLFSKNDLACILAPYLFIMGGGTGFLNYFNPKLKSLFYTDFVHQLGAGKNGCWLQPVIHILLPQRASLYSLPIAWGVIFLFMSNNPLKMDIRLYVGIGLLVASLAQVQAHSVIALGQWGMVYALIFLFKSRNSERAYLIYNFGSLSIVAICLGLFQIFPYLGRASNNLMRFQWIWKDSNVSVFQFWWNGLGCFIVISLFNGIVVLNNIQLNLYLPSIIVFLLGNYIMYQPWNLDNTKVFNAAFIPLAVAVVANFFSYMKRKTKIYMAPVFFVLFISCCLSGFLSLRMAYVEKYSIWETSDHAFELGEWIKNNTPHDSIWVTDQWHAHPVSSIAGRQILIGYGGWIHSHGLKGNDRTAAITDLVNNPDGTKSIDNYHIDYICKRSCSRGGDCLDFNPKSKRYSIVYQQFKYTIYKVNK